ncbi:TPT domain-containing protein [Aphelenchoides bicaudatus]|nr:TPT domain-containing protein [Aphelenchoides bicaudatus]
MLKLLLMVGLYYPLSVGLTFYQKWFIKNYRLPLLVVSGHYVTKYLLAVAIRWFIEVVTRTRRTRVGMREQIRWLLPVGACASLDIGLSNWALEYVTVSLYTMAKSSSILFIVGFSLLLRLERWRPSLGVAATFIAFGLVLFTWRAEHLDVRGLSLVELAAFCTGIRWTVSQLIMQGDDQPSPLRNPLDMVAHVQPWMFLTILPVVIVVEGQEISVTSVTSFKETYQPMLVLILVLFGGVLAFLMEMSEYLLLVNTSGITLNILGIIKEVVTLLLAHYLHGDKITLINLMGLVLTLCGMLIHGLNKHSSHQRKASARTSLPGSKVVDCIDMDRASSCSLKGSFGLGDKMEDRQRLLSSGVITRILSAFSNMIPYKRFENEPTIPNPQPAHPHQQQLNSTTL